MSKEVLQSCLFEAGAKFAVSEFIKDSTFGPGTTGFVSYIDALDESYQNLAKVVVATIRRGKSGKERLDINSFYIPIFYFDNENFRKLMPNDNRKHYVHIERDMEHVQSVEDMDPIDFLGWAAAMITRLRRMNENCKHKRWPEDKSNPLNQMKRAIDHFEGESESILDKMTNADFRMAFINECRQKASAMIKMHLEFDLKKLSIELNAAEFLEFTNKGEFIPKDAEDKTNEYEFTKDNELLERSVAYYKSVRDEVQKLSDEKRKRKPEK